MFRSKGLRYIRIVRESNIIFVVRKKNKYVINVEKVSKYLILSPEI